MVIAVCSFALAIDDDGAHRRHLPRLGRPHAAARARGRGRSSPARSTGTARGAIDARGARSASASSWPRPPSPIDDQRGSAVYRRHALAVLARRSLKLGVDRMRLTCTINGEPREVDGVWEGESLLLRAARAARAAGLQERVRAGRVRLVLGLPRRRAGVLVPGAGRPGRGPRDRHRRGARAGRGRAAPDPGGVPAGRRRAVRLLHARADRRHARPARAQRRARPTPRSARRWPATCAAARATRRSSTPCGWRPRR